MTGTLTLLDDLVTNTGGMITVEGTGTLDLTGGDTVNNGQFNNRPAAPSTSAASATRSRTRPAAPPIRSATTA